MLLHRKRALIFILTIYCSLAALHGSAQQEQAAISGTVKDAKGPLPGVSVMVKGAAAGTTTDGEGKFSIRAPGNAVLVFSLIGYQTLEEPVNQRKAIDMVLKEKAEELGEVVVTALGIKRNTRTLAYATQTLEGSKLTEVQSANANVLNSLAGKIAGVVVTPAASGPGSATRIVLRGNRSISGTNNALIILDGVPVDNSQGTQPSDENGGYAGSDGANNINPDDIESVNVLKGPSAAALYGSRAANGAIMINTKKGAEGPVRVNYSGGVSIDKPWLLIPYQNTYGRGSGGKHAPKSGFSWGPAAQTYPGNVASFFNTATSVTNSINVSGGSEKVQAYGSYANNYSGGIVEGNRLNRHSMNMRINTRITPRLTTDAKLTYLNQEIKNKPRLGEVATVMNAYIMPRDVSEEELEHFEDISELGQPVPNRNWPTVNAGIYMNPYWFTRRTSYNEARNRITLLASAKYQLLDWLSIQGRFGLDRYDDKTNAHFYEWTTVPTTNKGGNYYEIDAAYRERNIDVLVSGNNKIAPKLQVSYNIGGSVLSRKSASSTSTANGLIYPNMFYLHYASTPSMSNAFSERELQSVYGNVQFAYNNFLYLDASARNDWSSTLPSPYSFFYPSVGISAILSDMIAMPKWISFGKVRASYTQVGNDASPYLLRQTYTPSQGGTGGFVNRGVVQAIANLKPEQTRSLEAGLEWKFLDNRLGIDATFYKTNTKNQLLTLNLVAASGFSSRYLNAGNVENKGVELALNAVPVSNKNFTWSTTVNFARNVNTVIALDPEVPRATLGGSDRLGRVVVQEGGVYGDIYGRVWAKDDKGRYLVTDEGTPVSAQAQYIGNYNPKFNLGWSNNFQYKGLSLSLLVDGRVGGIIVSGTDAYMAAYGLADYTVPFRDGGLVLPGVHKNGTENTTPINAETFWSTVGEGGRAGWAQFFAYENTNFRLREASLGYDLNLKSKVIKAARISLTGRNLFFFYRGKALMEIPGIKRRTVPVDPETSLGAGNSQGLESGLPPAIRSYGLNLKVAF